MSVIDVPTGNFQGYEKRHLWSLEPDPELTKVGPDTPCGDYLRRFWMPFEMTERVKDLPRRVRLLGEDLVCFRDKSGTWGLLHINCSHRGTSLEFGIVEDKGLRCCYHGWKYAADGTILETPGEPPASKIKDRVRHGAYPVVEFRGLLFAYLGPAAEMPPFPNFDMYDLANDTMVPFIIPSPCNWLQISENSFDPYHTVFLHARVVRSQFENDYFAYLPVIEIFERQHGFFYLNARRVEDRIWLRVHDHLHPNFSQNGSMFPSGDKPEYFLRAGLTRWVVPVDDTHSLTVAWRHFIDGADPRGIGKPEDCGYNKVDFYGQTDERSYEQRQRDPGDYDAWTSQGAINVHRRENLGHTDLGVARVRQKMREEIRALKAGGRLRNMAELGNPIPTYGGDTILRLPKRNEDDRKFIAEVCHKVAAIYRTGDAYAGRDRDDFIVRELKNLEAYQG